MSDQLKNLFWIEEILPVEVISRKMHGGVGYYLEEKLVLILVESGRSYEHKGVSYPFVIWNGCLFPVEPIKQGRIFMDYPFLENHPASPKWLYLPTETEDFEEHVQKLVREIKKRNPLFGVAMKAEKILFDESEDISKPRLFSDAPALKKKTAAEIEKPKTKKVVKEKKIKKDKKIKADKKSENSFLMNILKRRS